MAFAAVAILAAAGGPASAANRSLSLHFTHTGEEIDVVYKRNGRFVPSALRDLNRFLRDWRRNEATKMDPELFDLLWEVQQEFGGRRISVVSAYRSPATNQMLRKRSRGVARRSQHMAGKAVDFFIKGANMAKVRQAGMKRQVGGVGYYPRSGTAFVHFDTGRVRSWPRMSRRQLSRLFPDGKTLHLPSNGKPLKGYKQAQALEKAGKLQRLRGGGGGNLLAGILGGGRERNGAGSSASSSPGSDRVRNTRTASPADDDRPVPVRTASLSRDRISSALPRSDTRPARPAAAAAAEPSGNNDGDGEGQGLFRQLPGVSLGGLINRFRGDEDGAAESTPSPSPSVPTVTSVAPNSGDPIGAVISDTPLPSAQSPAERPDEPAQDQPVVVAAVPPTRPDIETLLEGTTALGYAGPADNDAALDAAQALAGQTLSAAVDGEENAIDVATLGSDITSGFEPAPAPGSGPSLSEQIRQRPTASLATTLTPVRGASPALIATKTGIEGETFSGFVAPNRNGDGVSQVLLVGGFLGAPKRFSRNGPDLPNPDGFKGLRITLFPSPRS
ncbi:MAG: DUF882 domain-containing protein [Pseudomonadota bacterium]